VSRRLALVGELPASVQSHVRSGAIGAHAAMKYFVPLARANGGDCIKLADAIAWGRHCSRRVAPSQASVVRLGWTPKTPSTRDPEICDDLHARGRGGSNDK